MDRNAAKGLKRCETDSIALENCLALSTSGLTKKGAKAIGESAGWP